ncbi:hypothetical protein [Pseudomonas sp. GL-RE-26]|uniref:hypothetical protein n=1 Tax=Pseudomonas sp. GL-RE-26 TaxID=2832390 RepID=UPI001CBFF8E0|nr:hypothetical protein [Pseudomonas sp. GL-RE-26]
MTVENRKPRINIEKMSEWLNARIKTNECPFCKQTRWEAINGTAFVGCAIPYGDGRGEMYLGGYPVLPLICTTCNFVRNIALTSEVLEQVLEDEQIATQ